MVCEFLPDLIVVDGNPTWVKARDPHGRVGRRAREGIRYECPCCGYPTLEERRGYEICFLCNWEDDGQDDPMADQVRGGPNYHLSLTKARENFKVYRDSCAPLEDRSLTRDTETEWTAKGRSIQAFEAMRVTTDAKTLSHLWWTADDVHGFLSRMLDSRIREYEQKHKHDPRS